ncbi:MAG: hypothetical protein H7Z37_00870 [Pyrinomonadaceae bacterium]|nr:hypothetical protein [Pyrinomonadaceae bacterium]
MTEWQSIALLLRGTLGGLLSCPLLFITVAYIESFARSDHKLYWNQYHSVAVIVLSPAFALFGFVIALLVLCIASLTGRKVPFLIRFVVSLTISFSFFALILLRNHHNPYNVQVEPMTIDDLVKIIVLSLCLGTLPGILSYHKNPSKAEKYL